MRTDLLCVIISCPLWGEIGELYDAPARLLVPPDALAVSTELYQEPLCIATYFPPSEGGKCLKWAESQNKRPRSYVIIMSLSLLTTAEIRAPKPRRF